MEEAIHLAQEGRWPFDAESQNDAQGGTQRLQPIQYPGVSVRAVLLPRQGHVEKGYFTIRRLLCGGHRARTSVGDDRLRADW